jgi:hypothetical protein
LAFYGRCWLFMKTGSFYQNVYSPTARLQAKSN